MYKIQQTNLKKNIEKMSGNLRKEIAGKTTKENYQEDTQQKCYMNGITRGLIENTREE